jgi:hypothetical protein
MPVIVFPNLPRYDDDLRSVIMPGIFISYRRNDAAGFAGRIYDRLVAHFGSSAVFIDVTGIAPGSDFMKVIENCIRTCSAVVAVIGESWCCNTEGLRRLENPDDSVRREIETALHYQVPVIPVLVGTAAVMPQPEELPESIRSFSVAECHSPHARKV